jgi:hypothetical protein
MKRRTCVAIAVIALLVSACGKRDADVQATQEKQRAAREAEEKRREEKTMANPDKVFDRALKSQEKSAQRSAEHRKKVDDEAQKKWEALEAGKK